MATDSAVKNKAMMTIIPVDIRRQALGALRADGITMQAFLTHILRLMAQRDPRVVALKDELRDKQSSDD